MKSHSLMIAPLLFALCAQSSIVHAQAADANRVAARALAFEANAALEKKDYATAAERFARADALVHAPTLLLGLARANVGLGKLVVAHGQYARIVREGVSPGSPAVFSRAVDDAKKELAALEPRMPAVTAEGKGPKEPGTVLPLAPAPSGTAVAPATTTLVPSPSAALVTAPGAPLVTPPVASPVVKLSSPPSTPDVRLRRTLGFVALGVGSLGLVTGAVTGILALQIESDLSAVCPNARCRPSTQSSIDTYSALRLTAGSTLLAGAALAATGTLLVLTTPRPASRGGFVRPVIGAGYFRLEGAF